MDFAHMNLSAAHPERLRLALHMALFLANAVTDLEQAAAVR
jgi:hypothetical protein